jgi:hypothetical protein
VEELYHHLQGIGVEVAVLEKGNSQEKVGWKRSRGEKPVGVIEMRGKNIDSINIIGIASQYGVNYFLDYLVRISSFTGGRSTKKTRMIKKNPSVLQGKVIDIQWKGDDFLAHRLNFDYRLKDKLLQADRNTIKGDIWIYPESKYGYARIRTSYFLPPPHLFEAIDTIAKHVKSEW